MSTTQTNDHPAAKLAHGQTTTVGNYEIRNFHGFLQSREGATGPWQFQISGFDSTSSGEAGTCSLILAKGGVEQVPIDAQDRVLVYGKRYGRENWKH